MAHIGAFTNRLGGGKPSQVGETAAAAAASGNGFWQLRARDPELIRADHHLPNNVDAHATIICPHLVNFGLSPKVRAGEARRRRDTKRTQTDSVVSNFQPAALMQLGHEAAERQSLVISAPFPPAAS